MAFKIPLQHKFTIGPMAYKDGDGNNGFFAIPFKKGHGKHGKHKYFMMCIASDRHGWDRVSCYPMDEKGNTIPRTPIFEEMEAVKKYFWDDSDSVIQFHSLNTDEQQNPYMLHIWRPQLAIFPTPPKEAII